MEQRGNENMRKHDEQIAHCAAACYKLINMTKNSCYLLNLRFVFSHAYILIFKLFYNKRSLLKIMLKHSKGQTLNYAFPILLLMFVIMCRSDESINIRHQNIKVATYLRLSLRF